MIKEKVLAAYETIAVKYAELIDHKPHNAYYDRPNMLRLIGDVQNKRILDAACGPGKYAEVLLAQGAAVTGFDLSPRMVALAKQRNGTEGNFFVHDLAEPFPHFAEESFDLVLCALALHYISDWTLTVKEFHRVLSPGGRVVISVEHPFFEYTYYRSKAYFDIEAVHGPWRGFGTPVEVHSYRRPLQSYLMPFLAHGFHLQQLLEPLPTAEFARLDPKHYRELCEFPAFMCLSFIKK